jgi:hypothetical protein
MRSMAALLSPVLLSAMVVAAGTTRAGTTELRTIDRTVPAEPAYGACTQGYCLLVFGAEAKTRVWLVRDGDTLHVHDSPDGKAPARWRQVARSGTEWRLGDIWENGGTVRHRGLTYNPEGWGPEYQYDMWLSVRIGDRLQSAGQDPRGALKFAATPKDAPIVHFNGPLTLDLHHTQKALRTGRTVRLTAVVGTPGVGPGTFALFDVDAYPANQWPTARIEYPAKDGGPPIVAKVALDGD